MSTANAPIDQGEEFVALKARFVELLSTDEGDHHYEARVRKLISTREQRLNVDLNDIRNFSPELASRLLSNPLESLPAFEAALNQVVTSLEEEDDGLTDKKTKTRVDYKIGIQGSFGSRRVNPRHLTSKFLSQLVCIEGIVTRCSVIRPKLVQTVHYCEATAKYTQQNYRDQTALMGAPTGSAVPTKDEFGNPLITEFGLSTFKNHQSLTIQEMPEQAPKGLLPCSVNVILNDDLVDAAKPGDRIQVTAIYRAMTPLFGNKSSATYPTLGIGVSVRHLGQHSKAITPLTRKDIEEIRRVSERKDHFSLLANSIAPSIYGHEYVFACVH